MPKWTPAESKFVAENADKLSDEQLAAELTKKFGKKVTVASVTKYRQRRGLGKTGGRGCYKVTKRKTKRILTGFTLEELASMMGLSTDQEKEQN